VVENTGTRSVISRGTRVCVMSIRMAGPGTDGGFVPVCGSCHTESISKLHMEQNGGSYGATKNADGTSNEAPLETCGTCHGEGGIADVKVEHGVGEFNYN